MEYIFGSIRKNNRVIETVKTVGDKHTDLKGRLTVKREYPDMTIVDTFTVIDHYNTSEDSEGNCYDFYTIEAHYRDTDRFMPQKEDIESKIEFIAMMSDIDIFDDETGSEVGINE